MLANFSNLITFSRGTNATLVDASGQLTYAPNNVLTNSQDFEAAAWTKSSGGTGSAATVTANSAAAPDGTTTADTIVLNRGAGNTITDRSFISQNLTGLVATAPYLFSFYIKAAPGEAGKQVAYRSVAGGSYQVVTLTDTWQRVSVLENAFAASTSVEITSRGTITTSNSVSCFLWGAQLEAVTYQTTPSPYVSTSVANLLGFSEAFDNAAWTKDNAAIVTGAAQNPINNLWNAQKLMENTATGNHRTFQGVSITTGIRYTYSVYAKAAERNRLLMTCAGGVVLDAIFDLSNGTVAVSTSGTASIQSVGNGWYRCAITDTATSTTSANMQIRLIQSGTVNSYTGDGNSGIYIYGAQLSNSGSLDPYVPTPAAAPSSTAYYGPRFDYDPVTLAAKGILIEEARTNLLTYSEQFDNGAWSKARISVTPNAQVAPDGTLTADVVTANVGTSDSISQGPTLTAAIHTVSIYLRGTSSSTQVTIGLFSGGFLPATGQILSGPGSISGSGLISVTGLSTTQWTRISFTTTSATPAGSVPLLIYPGGGGTANASIAMWGAQLEAGAFATSYIPTVASTVTRSADVASITGSLFNQWTGGVAGTFLASWSSYVLTTPPANRQIVGFGGTTGLAYVNTGNTFNSHDGANYATAAGTITTAGPHKGAWTFGASSMTVCLNGGAVGSGTYNNTFGAATSLGIASNGSALFVNGHIRNITYIPNRISDAQLQAATS